MDDHEKLMHEYLAGIPGASGFDNRTTDERIAENMPIESASAIDTTRPTPVDRDHIMQFFAYAHLPAHLQAVSAPFSGLAESLVATVPRNPERTVALRKLLEAKDAAVRAVIAK